MCTTEMKFCKIKYIVFKIKILTVLLLCRSFGNLTFLIKPFFCITEKLRQTFRYLENEKSF